MAKTIKIGGRLESVETGNIVAGANQIIDDAKNKKQSVINGEVDAELVRLDETKQDVLTFDNAPTEGSNNPVKSGGVYAADALLQQAIEAILLLIPSAASALNKLVDEQKMNSSISTNTATFRGTYNSVVDLHLSVDATHQQIAEELDSIITTADNNDYAYVQIPVSEQTYDIRKTERYTYNGTAWAFEYELNTSGFTADQWAAINSGINATIVGEIGDIQNVIPSEATIINKLADKAYVIAQILAAIPAFKGTYETLAGLEAVQSPKDGDIGIVLTMADDGMLTYGFYQYLNDDWNQYYTLSLRPKDKPASTGITGDYPYNGMGRVVLQKNIVSNVNTLTQDMFYKGEVGSRVPNANTIFVIQYDFVLGEDITVPANCVLEFDGGSISASGNNYTITGQNTDIIASEDKILTGIILSGTWTFNDIRVEWFGVAIKNSDETNHNAFYNIVLSCLNTQKNIYFGNSGTYNFKYMLPIKPSENYHNIKIYGNGCSTRINVTHIRDTKEMAIWLYQVQNLTLSDFQLTCSDGENTYNGEHGVAFMGYNENISLENLYIHDFYQKTDGGRAISFHQGYEEPFNEYWEPVYSSGSFVYSASQYVKNIAIRNCRLSACTNAFSYWLETLDSSTVPSSIANMEVSNNLIESCDLGLRFAAYLQGTSNAVANVGIFIRNNRFINNTIHIDGTMCGNIDIANNVINGTKTSTVYNVPLGIILASCSNVLLSNNKISGCGTYGMVLRKYGDATFYDCENILCSYNIIDSVDYGITNKYGEVSGEGIKNLVLVYNILTCNTAGYDFNNYQAYYQTTLFTVGNRYYSDGNFTQKYSDGFPAKINQDEGAFVFSTMRNKPLWFNANGIWQDAQGNPYDTDYSGSTRPTNVKVGTCFFDTSLSPARPIYWNGTAWVDATGATV